MLDDWKKKSFTYKFICSLFEHVAELADGDHLLTLFDSKSGSIVTQLRSTELLNLLKGQIELLNNHLERDVESGKSQDVINTVHYEIFQPLNV